MAYSKEDVKEAISMDNIMTLLEHFGANPEDMGDFIIADTICHNGDSHKLYYYDNTKLFNCYTQCGPFDIFELVMKVKETDDLNAAIYFLVNFFNLQHFLQEADSVEYDNEDWKLFNIYDKYNNININTDKVVLPKYNEGVLKKYPKPLILPWQKDHITKEVCDAMGICYDPVNGAILIPHLDENNRCVGIRQRTLVKEQEQWGKYRPWKHAGTWYNHPLAFNLYGLNVAQENIKKTKSVLVVESEKSVLQYMSYFGIENSIAVAVCGSSISKYQFNLLKELGAKEVIVGFDHDFQNLDSEDCYKVIDHLLKINQKYGAYANISFLFDKEQLLPYKASPTDMGKEAFMYLFKNRIVL